MLIILHRVVQQIGCVILLNVPSLDNLKLEFGLDTFWQQKSEYRAKSQVEKLDFTCIRRCGTEAYQPLSSQRLGCGGSKVYWDGRESVRSPRNQRRKLSVRYDAVRPAGVARTFSHARPSRVWESLIYANRHDVFGMLMTFGFELVWNSNDDFTVDVFLRDYCMYNVYFNSIHFGFIDPTRTALTKHRKRKKEQNEQYYERDELSDTVINVLMNERVLRPGAYAFLESGPIAKTNKHISVILICPILPLGLDHMIGTEQYKKGQHGWNREVKSSSSEYLKRRVSSLTQFTLYDRRILYRDVRSSPTLDICTIMVSMIFNVEARLKRKRTFKNKLYHGVDLKQHYYWIIDDYSLCVQLQLQLLSFLELSREKETKRLKNFHKTRINENTHLLIISSLLSNNISQLPPTTTVTMLSVSISLDVRREESG
ncbi:hypothetical protein WN51_11724 [Melipona quadrifasciata]|uniref:Uncharacterized protein n=1 Tax=Melipona quadrifasciata TaxID=166423 RepID=A0A0M9A5J5_9HYME|nr:hypothetical protein WN51_11724 [Melipona quadrifasciata]